MAELGIAAGAEALGEIHAELDFFAGETGMERADVGIERQQLSALHAVERDPLQHIRAGTAKADDFNGGRGDRLLRISRVGNHGFGKD